MKCMVKLINVIIQITQFLLQINLTPLKFYGLGLFKFGLKFFHGVRVAIVIAFAQLSILIDDSLNQFLVLFLSSSAAPL